MFNIVLEVLAKAIRPEKRNKIAKLKKKTKLSQLVDYIILYVANPKESTKEVLQLISKHSKVAQYKINMQKSIVFIYIRINDTNMTLENNSTYNSIKKNT